MNKIEVRYDLSSTGQKNAVLLGLSGSKEQTVMVEGTHELVNHPLTKIERNGEIYLGLRIAHPYFNHSSEYVTQSSKRRTDIHISTSVNYNHLAIEFDTPMQTADQVIAFLDEIDREVAALESTKKDVAEQWCREDAASIKASIEHEMDVTKNHFGIRFCDTKDYFTPEFNAEIEAANARVLKHNEDVRELIIDIKNTLKCIKMPTIFNRYN